MLIIGLENTENLKKGRENGKIKDMKTNFKPIKIISRAEKGAAE